jgi:DNA gyrase subunit B
VGTDNNSDLSTIAAMRKRPGMWVGDVHDGSGLHHLIWEVVANVLDEHLAGWATRLDVSVVGDRVTIADDGRGLSVEIAADGIPYVESVFIRHHDTPTDDDHFPHVHVVSNLRGVGVVVVGAFSHEVEVNVRRDGAHYRQRFARGVPQGSLERLGETLEHGTVVSFVPDPEIFTTIAFDIALITERLREIAYLNPDLRVSLQGERLVGGDGLGTYCSQLASNVGPLLAPPLRLRGRHKLVDVDVAVGWAPAGSTTIYSYVSQARTLDHGAHVEGFWRGVRTALKAFDPQVASVPTRALRRALGEGLVTIVHAGLYHPVFDSPTKSRIRNPEARSAVARVVAGGLAVYLLQYPTLRHALLARLTLGDSTDRHQRSVPRKPRLHLVKP